MDCLRAQEIVSATIGQPDESSTPEFVAARHHCASCPACRSFLAAALRLHETPGPKAPPALMERVTGAVVVEAHAQAARRRAAEEEAARREAAAESAEDGEPADADEQEAIPFPLAAIAASRNRGRSWWLAWGGGIAAVLLVTFVAGRAGLRMLGGSAPSAEMARRSAPVSAPGYTDTDSAEKWSSTGDRSSAATSAADSGTVIDRPAYVTLGTYVYEETRQIPSVPSGAEAAGYVLTARAGGGTPQNLAAYLGSDSSTLFVKVPEGALEYRAVTRSLGGRRYVLSSESVLDRYGNWPQLPSRYAVPETVDGTPTFEAGPKDDSGQQTYVVPGNGPDAGFALPPGEGAAGNPNWTWWEPLR